MVLHLRRVLRAPCTPPLDRRKTRKSAGSGHAQAPYAEKVTNFLVANARKLPTFLLPMLDYNFMREECTRAGKTALEQTHSSSEVVPLYVFLCL